MRSVSVTQTGNLWSRVLRICGILFLAIVATATAAAQVASVPPYTVSVFATSVLGVYYQPDSITLWNGNVFVGYGNNAKTTGGGHSTIMRWTELCFMK
jgi:hypothetical protein